MCSTLGLTLQLKVKTMIKVSVMYPNSDKAFFDINYYVNTHFPLVSGLLGDALIGVSVDSGLSGGTINEKPAFIAIGHLMFDSLKAFEDSFSPHAEEILADLPNFTNVQPQVQVNKVEI